MREFSYKTLVEQVHNLRPQLLRKRSEVALLFDEYFTSIYTHPNYDKPKCHKYLRKREHLVIGYYGHVVPSFDEIMQACIKTLDNNGVIIRWDT